jgi:Fe-S-cluster containining protein
MTKKAPKKKKKATKGLKNSSPCYGCASECCQYFAVYIDEPTDLEEYDAVKWYLYHRKTSVYIDKEEDWYVHIEVPCRELDKQGKCRSYEGRPMVCRNYEPTACERADIDVKNIAEFDSVQELDDFFKLNYRVIGTDLKRRRRTYQTA